MAEIKKGKCYCKDCVAKMANEKKHLEHPFYKKVDEVTDEVKIGQILKGANKYDEPFNPASWTNKELVWHQLQELRDAQVYGVGLLERLEEQEAAYNNLLKDYEIVLQEAIELREVNKHHANLLTIARHEAEYWRLRAIANAENVEKINQTKGGNY